MTKEVRCPICGNSAKWIYWSEGYWGIVEEHTECDKCGYCKEFVYGNSILSIGNKMFTWFYNTKNSDPVFRRIKRAIFMARRNWKKYKRKKK